MQQIINFIADKSYDFNYQQTRMTKDEKLILPGDHLKISCLYDSIDRTTATFVSFLYSNNLVLQKP